MLKQLLILVGLLISLSGLCAQNARAAFEPKVKTIRVNGVDLAYVEAGRGEPLVLVHGFMHDYRVWLKQVEGLSQRYRVIAYSRRYRYPNAPAPQDVDVTQKANISDLAAFIRALKLGRVHLAGHSAGARLIPLLAREHPDLVRSLILGEGPAPTFPGEDRQPARQPFMMEARQAYERGDLEEAIHIFARGVLGTEPTKLHPSVFEISRANSWEFRRLGVPDPSVTPLTCEEAQRIMVPILFIRGENSPAQFQASAAGWKRCVARIEEAVLSGSSHGLQLENPDGYNRLVLDFLSQWKLKQRKISVKN